MEFWLDALAVLIFALVGVATKLVDDYYDAPRAGRQKAIAKSKEWFYLLFSIIYALVGGLTLVFRPDVGAIFLAIFFGVLIAHKVDNKAFLYSAVAFIMVLLASLALGKQSLYSLRIALIVFLAIGELGDEIMRHKFLKAKSLLGKISAYYPVMKLFGLAAFSLGRISLTAFLCLLVFDAGYYLASKKKHN
ncbi:hypothetical protein HY993_00165 [Candidatus Micrarchaeota archaeon]|nr:hypothetical protein [Candidatus Micrarchaeota archaeon]